MDSETVVLVPLDSEPTRDPVPPSSASPPPVPHCPDYCMSVINLWQFIIVIFILCVVIFINAVYLGEYEDKMDRVDAQLQRLQQYVYQLTPFVPAVNTTH